METNTCCYTLINVTEWFAAKMRSYNNCIMETVAVSYAFVHYEMHRQCTSHTCTQTRAESYYLHGNPILNGTGISD